MKKGLFIIIFIVSINTLTGQDTPVDSLNNLYNNASSDTSKVQLLISTGDLFLNENPGKSVEYYKKAVKLSVKSFENSFNTDSIEIQYTMLKLYAILLKNIATAYKNNNDPDAALQYYNKALDIEKIINNKTGIIRNYINIGNVFRNQAVFDKAIDNYLIALKISEEISDDKFKSICYSNMGIVYKDQNLLDEALKNYLLSLEIDKSQNNQEGMSDCFTNIGIVYYLKKNYDTAITYYDQSYEIDKSIGNIRGCFDYYINMGLIYNARGDYNKSIEYNGKALDLIRGMSMKNIEAGLFLNIAWSYMTMADSFALHQKTDRKIQSLNLAIKNGLRSYELSVEIMAHSIKRNASNLLMKAYYSLKNTDLSLKYAMVFIGLNDSLFSEEKAKYVTEVTTKYETEKKQILIEKLNKEKELDEQTIIAQKAVNDKQRLITVSVLAGFMILLFFTILTLRLYRLKKKANILLAERNEQIMLQKEEISTQRDEIAVQCDLVTGQRDIISHQQKDIKDSIRYAFQIQSALFPTNEDLRIILKDHFIFYRPRDIVSGDFYWVNKSGNKIIVLVSDCTGHGVPGAFMSMLGIAFLNEIVNKENITDPAQILNRLRENVIIAMKQHGENVKQQDGMDSVAITIDRTAKTLEFAGANNPLYIIKRQNIAAAAVAVGSSEPVSHTASAAAAATAANDGGLIEVKGDKMPVSIYSRMQPFTNHTIPIDEGDLLYIFSDGMADQFGGPEGKKFKYKALKDLLMTNSQKPMAIQKENLIKAFDDWKGETEQIDDVLILGIRV